MTNRLEQLATGLLAFLVLATSAAHAGDVPASPLRLALPPLKRLIHPTPASTFDCALGLYLRGRLQESGSVRLVSDDRAEAVFRELVSEVRDSSPDTLLGEFCRFVPVDACVLYEPTEENTRIRVWSRSRATNVLLEVAQSGDFASRVRAAAAAIADALPLPRPDRRLLAEVRVGDPAVFQAYYGSQRWPVPLISPTYRGPEYGDIRLAYLRDAWSENKTEPCLGEQIVLNAYELSVSTRERDFYKANWRHMATLSFSSVLGTPYESSAYPLARRLPRDFEEQLLELCKPFAQSAGDPLDMADITPLDAIDTEPATVVSPGPGMGSVLTLTPVHLQNVTVDRRLGALRVLGMIGTPKARVVLSEAAQHEDPRVREAVAFALAESEADESGTSILKALADDENDRVAFTAARGLETRGAASPRLMALARRFTAPGSDLFDAAVDVFCRHATRVDLPAARALLENGAGRSRVALITILARFGGLSIAEEAMLIGDPDADAVEAVLAARAGADVPPVLLPALKRLANDPCERIAGAARGALAAARPSGRVESLLFDIETAHPYLRARSLRTLARDPSAEATAILRNACTNTDSHTRALALTLLTDRDRAAARDPVLAALADPYRWVRFHACALAPRVADSASEPILSRTLDLVSDEVERLYLQDALAVARGLPVPAGRLAARSVAGTRNLAWNTSPALYAPDSPFDAYYCMQVRPNAYMRAAHEAGKILFGRAASVPSPGLIVLDRATRDAFWMDLDDELAGDVLDILDGVVYGEETFNIAPGALWQDGWRPFCAEADIDPERVAGDIATLTASEHGAWTEWAIARHVEGFNILYDYTKLKHGKRRPGLQVCTFTPSQSLPYPASQNLAEWKFDVGGVYDYKGDNRMAGYNMIRRYKTIWPERPVLWLSLGIGGYEMNVVRHHQKVPRAPMLDRYNRSFSDSLTAWLAGADTGWFSTWMFVKPDFKRQGMAKLRGVQLWVEDLGPNAAGLDKAIDWTFSGVDETELRRLDGPAPTVPDTDVLDEGDDGLPDLDVDDSRDHAREEIAESIAMRKHAFKNGFLFYRNYVYDCARIFGSLPRHRPKPKALAVQHGVNVWTRPTAKHHPRIPGRALLSEYDFLCDVNLAASTDLSRYRYIVIHDPGPLRDATIASLTAWLRETPGLLVVHVDLSARNSDEAGTVEDHDGRLQNDWPWEPDIRIGHRRAFSRLPPPARPAEGVSLTGPSGEAVTIDTMLIASWWEVTGPAATPLYTTPRGAVLALWRNPLAFKGAVLFDGVEHASADYLEHLRNVVNELHADTGIGIPISGPAVLETSESPQFSAAASSRYFAAAKGQVRLNGVDIMTGDPMPEVGGGLGSKSALVARDFVGRYVAASSAITAVSETPFVSALIDGPGLVLESRGAVRIASTDGSVRITTTAGTELPQIEDAADWLLFTNEDGITTFPRRQGHVITYVRSREPLRVKLP